MLAKWWASCSGLNVLSSGKLGNLNNQIYKAQILLKHFPFILSQNIEYETLNSEYIDGLEQERQNSSGFAMELSISCTNPSICTCHLKPILQIIIHWYISFKLDWNFNVFNPNIYVLIQINWLKPSDILWILLM